MIGPGKYDDLCTEARLKAKALGAVLIILDGEKGPGFSVQAPLAYLPGLARVLRSLADDVDRDTKRDIRDLTQGG